MQSCSIDHPRLAARDNYAAQRLIDEVRYKEEEAKRLVKAAKKKSGRIRGLKDTLERITRLPAKQQARKKDDIKRLQTLIPVLSKPASPVTTGPFITTTTTAFPTPPSQLAPNYSYKKSEKRARAKCAKKSLSALTASLPRGAISKSVLPSNQNLLISVVESVFKSYTDPRFDSTAPAPSPQSPPLTRMNVMEELSEELFAQAADYPRKSFTRFALTQFSVGRPVSFGGRDPDDVAECERGMISAVANTWGINLHICHSRKDVQRARKEMISDAFVVAVLKCGSHRFFPIRRPRKSARNPSRPGYPTDPLKLVHYMDEESSTVDNNNNTGMDEESSRVIPGMDFNDASDAGVRGEVQKLDRTKTKPSEVTLTSVPTQGQRGGKKRATETFKFKVVHHLQYGGGNATVGEKNDTSSSGSSSSGGGGGGGREKPPPLPSSLHPDDPRVNKSIKATQYIINRQVYATSMESAIASRLMHHALPLRVLRGKIILFKGCFSLHPSMPQI